MKHRYSQAHFPPAPLCQVRFGTPEEMRFTQPVEGMVDTGADMTIAPLALMRNIGATVGGLQSIGSQWGEARSVRMYIVDVEVEGVNFPRIWVVGDERGQEVVLGRNLLNRMKILLDGPAEEIEIVSY